MSVVVMSWVWEHSRAKGNNRLVLLAIADNANDDGGNAFPGIPTLKGKTKLAERTIHDCIRRLLESGELVIEERGGGAGRFTVYRVVTANSAASASPTTVQNPQGSRRRTLRTTTENTADHDGAYKEEPSSNHPDQGEVEDFANAQSSISPAPGADIVPMPTRVPAAMNALEALIGDLQAELDQGHRSWDMTGLAQKRWVELLDLCGGDLYPAQQFLGWFIRALVGVELGGHDWRRAFVLVRQWRGYAIKGAAEAIHHGRLPGGDADREATDRFWNYAGAVCKAEIARASKEGA